MMCSVGRDDSAHGDDDDDDEELFTFLDLQLLVRFNLAIHDVSSEWRRGLRRLSAAARLLGLQVRITPEAWMSVCCECCVLSGRGLCDGLITRPEES
jgi:transposase